MEGRKDVGTAKTEGAGPALEGHSWSPDHHWVQFLQNIFGVKTVQRVPFPGLHHCGTL